jgi:hypothetical protein
MKTAHGAARNEIKSLVDKVDMCQLQTEKKQSQPDGREFVTLWATVRINPKA